MSKFGRYSRVHPTARAALEAMKRRQAAGIQQPLPRPPVKSLTAMAAHRHAPLKNKHRLWGET